MNARVVVLGSSWALSSCGANSSLAVSVEGRGATPAYCEATEADVSCVAPNPTDPCGAPRAVAAECDAAESRWRCPSGARRYESERPSDVCLPFAEEGSPVRALSGGLVRVPAGDRCLWVAEEAELASGARLRNVAFTVAVTAPAGRCPRAAEPLGGAPRTVVSLRADDPRLLVQLTGGFRYGGVDQVTYRLFRADGGAHFGLTLLGSGVARWNAGNTQVVVPGPEALQTSSDTDLGDAAIVDGDYAYLYGCPGPAEFLTERCVVGRFGAGNRLTLRAGGAWSTTARGPDADRVFAAGPWVSSVWRADRGRLAHLFAVGFGTDLQLQRAAAPEGPWTDARAVARCALPADDTHAYCAGPVVVEALGDAQHPERVPVVYSVGSTAADQDARRAAQPRSYWPRLQWIAVAP